MIPERIQDRIAICPECGAGNDTCENPVKTEWRIYDNISYEIERLRYRCIVCGTLFEHELSWIQGKIVREETEMISFRTFKPTLKVYEYRELSLIDKFALYEPIEPSDTPIIEDDKQ